MSGTKVWSRDKKEAARALNDAAETGFPLSTEEVSVLQLAVNGDPACYERGLWTVLHGAIERNPRTALRDARDEARRVLEHSASYTGLLSEADQAFLARATRAKNITASQIKE